MTALMSVMDKSKSNENKELMLVTI